MPAPAPVLEDLEPTDWKGRIDLGPKAPDIGHKFTPARQAAFLTHYERTHAFHKSAKAAGVSGNTVRSHMKRNEHFHALVNEAAERYKELIEQEVHKRAIGYERELVYQGQRTGDTVEEYDARLLLALAKRHMPDEFAERRETKTTHNHTHDVSGQVVHRLDLASLTSEQRAALRVLLQSTDEAEGQALPGTPAQGPVIDVEPVPVEGPAE